MSICAPRVLIAAPASATGKTTVACGLMRALVRRGLKVQACKSGPDYIDPMFHAEVVGATSRNLDLFFAGAPLVCALLAKGAQQADVTVIEGAMGYYDGIAGSAQASAWELAAKTGTPCVLVIDGRGRALSAAAEVTGFVRFRDPSKICGVIVNRVSAGYFPRLKKIIEDETGVPVLGYLPVLADCGLESRHLGLVTASEVEGLRDTLDRIAAVLEDTVDLDALLELAAT
ncbi:MAG: AAA family ATPase, partial [Coriobacteriales bacterium]|nr:AAA family ATPase [Coriobacteriales bacterium]